MSLSTWRLQNRTSVLSTCCFVYTMIEQSCVLDVVHCTTFHRHVAHQAGPLCALKRNPHDRHSHLNMDIWCFWWNGLLVWECCTFTASHLVLWNWESVHAFEGGQARCVEPWRSGITDGWIIYSTWWSSRRDGPPEDAEQRKWFAGTASAEVAAGADQDMAQADAGQERSPAEAAAGAHQWKLLLMHILPKIKTQRQMAGQMTSSVWHLLTQRHRRYQSDARATSWADGGGETCTQSDT